MIFLPKFLTKVLFTSVPDREILKVSFHSSGNEHLIFFKIWKANCQQFVRADRRGIVRFYDMLSYAFEGKSFPERPLRVKLISCFIYMYMLEKVKQHAKRSIS